MKKHILYSLLLLVFFSKASSQSDLQWYIHNGKGKNGLNGIENNFTNSITSNEFSISGTRYPIETNGKNDILIIYEDYNHFNSREDITLDETDNCIEGYNISCNATPIYLYFTNLYEGEDDPPSVVVGEGLIPNRDVTNLQLTNQEEIVYANHDAKIGKDITIIIKNPVIEDKPDNDSGQNLNKVYKLYFFKDDVEFSHVFDGNKALIPYVNETLNQAQGWVSLNFNNNEPYKYINFRVISNSSKIGTYIDFDLKKLNGDLIDRHSEKIVDSHDPNYIEVLNIFERNPREYWAHMHVQCYNDSKLAIVDNTKISLNMPSTVDARTLEMTDWSYATTQGALTDISLSNQGAQINFNFSQVDDILSIQGETTIVHPSQVAWVEYIVKINSTNVVEVANINLKPLKPMTFFDGKPYDISRFIDRCFGNLSDRNDLCERQIQGPYYMGQFTETLALGSKTPTSTSLSIKENSQNCVESHCCKVKCHKEGRNQCCKDSCNKESRENSGKDKCCKKKKRFWKNVIPWVIAGVMTIIAVAD